MNKTLNLGEAIAARDGFAEWWQTRKDATVNADAKLRHVPDHERLRILCRAAWLGALNTQPKHINEQSH